MKKRRFVEGAVVTLLAGSISVAQESDAQRAALNDLSQRFGKLTVRQSGADVLSVYMANR